MKNRLDSVLTPQELKAVEKKLYEAKVRELKSRQIAKLKTDIAPWAETYEYKEITRRGTAKIWAVAGKDIPLVDEDITLKSQKIYSIVSGYRIFMRELAAARANGYALDSSRAVTVRRTIAEKENEIFFKGNSEYNIEGMLTKTGIQTADAKTVNAHTEWEYKTGEEILADIKTARALLNTQIGLEADTLILAPDQMQLLDQPVYAAAPLITVRKFIEDNKWFSRILEVPDIGSTYNGLGFDSFIVADTSEDTMEILLPMDITAHEAIMESPFFYNVAVEERYGGILVRYPKGIVRIDKV